MKKIGKDNKFTFNPLKNVLDKKIIGTSILNLNSSTFVGGYNDGLIKIWKTDDFEIKKIFTCNSNQIRKMIKQNDMTIISCSDDATIRACSLDSYEVDCSYNLSEHEDKINDILLLDLYDNNTLVSVNDDKSIRLWNLETKECVNTLKTEDIQTCLGKMRDYLF